MASIVFFFLYVWAPLYNNFCFYWWCLTIHMCVPIYVSSKSKVFFFFLRTFFSVYRCQIFCSAHGKSQKETSFSCVPAVSKAALKNRHGKSLLVRAVCPNSNNSKRIYEALNSRVVFALLAPTENLTAFF